MTETGLDELVKELIVALQGLETFPIDEFAARLYNKVRRIPEVSTFRSDLPVKPSFGDDQNSFRINGQDERTVLTELAVQSVVTALGGLSSLIDKPNFRLCVRKNAAKNGITENLVELSTLLFAEHVNSQLKESKLPNLTQLAKVEGLADAFKAKITNPRFIRGQISIDALAKDGGNFALSLLFVCESLYNGPAFMPWVGDEAFKKAQSCDVLADWTADLLDMPEHTPQGVFAFAGKAASLVTAPVVNGKLQMPGPKNMRSIVMRTAVDSAAKKTRARLPSSSKARSISRDDLDDIMTNDEALATFTSLASSIGAAWSGSLGSHWKIAVTQSCTEQSQTSRMTNKNTFGRGFVIGVTAGMNDHQRWEITTHTGQSVADWISGVQGTFPELFTNKKPEVKTVEKKKINKPASCFIAGTRVATRDGEVPIESISEGMRVLTNAATGSYGIASDEHVVTYTENTILIGFNNEGVFATPGHIFHTTTGPRAVEPEVARDENPWVEAGKLQPGNILYRLSADGKSYDLVPIKTMQIKHVPATKVYGVHLREGERSYHADGYRVAVNYPEITIKSVAAALEKLPRFERIRALAKIKELRPLFVKLGFDGIDRALTRELKAAKENKVKSLRRPQGVPLLSIKREFALTAVKTATTDKKMPPGYQLPLVEIFEGTLTVGGQFVHRVSFDSNKRNFQWSRPLAGEGEDPGLGFEHGGMQLSPCGLTGTGFVYITTEESPSAMPENPENVVAFMARRSDMVTRTDPSAKARNDVARLEHPRTTEAMAVKTSQHANPAAAAISKSLSSALQGNKRRIRKYVRKIVKKIKERVEAAADEQESDAPTFEAAEVVDEDEDDDDPYVPVPEPGYVDPPGRRDWYDAWFDEEPWPVEDTERTDCETPKYWGILALSTYHTIAPVDINDPEHDDDPDNDEDTLCGIQFPTIVLGYLDDLLDDINASRDEELALGPLYTSVVSSNDDGTIHCRVMIDSAAAISALSDQYQPPANPGDPEVLPTRDLTFNNIGSDVILPFLFAEAEFDFRYDFEEVNGACWEYDMSKEGCLGERYFFETRDDLNPPFLAARVADVSAKAAESSLATLTAGTGAFLEASQTPAPVTRALVQTEVPCLDRLVDILNYSDDEILTESQDLLQKTMLWHMDESEAISFLNLGKPSNDELPRELRQDLLPELKDWIRDVYSKAYITFMLSKVTPKPEEDWRETLDDEEKRKIWYWWNGGGENTLASSTEYNKLNEITAAWGMRSKYGNDLYPYIDYAVPGMTKSGGEYWAEQLLLDLTSNYNLLKNIANAPLNSDGVNLVTKYCNILHALAPSVGSAESYATQFFMAVLQFQSNEFEAATPRPSEADEGYQPQEWVPDFMEALIHDILIDKSFVNATIREQLLADLAELMEDIGQADVDNAEMIENLALENTAQTTLHVANLMRAFGLIGDGRLASGKSHMIKVIVDAATPKDVGLGPKGMAAMRGFYTICAAAGTGLASYQIITGWDKLEGAQKFEAAAILLSTYCDLFTDAIRLYRDYAYSTSQPTSIASSVEVDRRIRNQGFGHKRSPAWKNTMLNLNKQASGDVGEAALVRRVVEQAEKNTGGDFKVARQNVSWNVDWVDHPEGNPVKSKIPLMRKLNKAVLFFEGAALMLGLVSFVAMSVSLSNNWDDLTKTGRILSVMQVVLTGLTIAVEAAVVAGFVLRSAIVLPAIGGVLAVAGLVVAIVFMVMESKRDPPEPPLTDVELFVKDQAHSLISYLDVTPPTPSLTYGINKTDFNAGGNGRLIITATNQTTETITLTEVTTNIQCGDNDNCFFKQGLEGIGLLEDPNDNVAQGEVGYRQIGVDPPEEGEDPEIMTLVVFSADPVTDTVDNFRISMRGHQPFGSPVAKDLVLEPGQGFEIYARGVVHDVGEKDLGEIWLEVVESQAGGDKALANFLLRRTED